MSSKQIVHRRLRRCCCTVRLFQTRLFVSLLFMSSPNDWYMRSASFTRRMQADSKAPCAFIRKWATRAKYSCRWDLRHLNPIPLHGAKHALGGLKPILDLPAVVDGNFLYMVGATVDHGEAKTLCAARIARPFPNTLTPTITVRLSLTWSLPRS